MPPGRLQYNRVSEKNTQAVTPVEGTSALPDRKKGKLLLRRLSVFLLLLAVVLPAGCGPGAEPDHQDAREETVLPGETDGLAPGYPENAGLDGGLPISELARFDEESYLIQLSFYAVEGTGLGEVFHPPFDFDLYHRYSEDLDYSAEELLELGADYETAAAIWSASAALMHPRYLGMIRYFELFTDGESGYIGTVEPVQGDPDYFVFSLDLHDVLLPGGSIDREVLAETVLHELGHIITLAPDQVSWLEQEDSDPATYFIYEYDLDTTPHAYLNRFFQLFWADLYDEWSAFYYEYGILYEGEEDDYLANQEILQDYLDRFYAGHSERFVNSYAATSPVEDIAETFMIFVTGDRPGGTSISDRKVLFFYDYPELLEAREYARLGL